MSEELTPLQQVVLPPQIETQAAMLVDRLWGAAGMTLTEPKSRKAMVNIMGATIMQAFYAGVTHQKNLQTESKLDS